MPRNVFQTLTIIALVAATVFVAHNFVRYILRVNGGYSQWTVFTECTKTCGTGTRFRTRTCDNPSPRFGGFDCGGEDSQTFKCNILPCPINGGYGQWSEFKDCSVTCGEGVQQRERKCDNPEPQFGGKTCIQQELGPDVETQTCHKDPCPIDGGYSEWSSFSECTVTCGGGTHERTRECTNPAPANGGRGCEGLGPDKETEECQTEACPPRQDQGQQQNKEEEDKDSKNENEETKRDNEKESKEKEEDEKNEGDKKETEKKEESKKEDEKKEDNEDSDKKEENKEEDEKKEEKEEERKESDEKKQKEEGQ